MKKKMILDQHELELFMDGSLLLLASQDYHGQRLTLQRNGYGEFFLKHGDNEIYRGTSLSMAIHEWDGV